MAENFNYGKVRTRKDKKVEVKVGSGFITVEQSELPNLIEALSELTDLIIRDKALMNVGSA